MQVKPLAQRTDEDVVEALRAGDEDTFRALIDAHSPALLRVAQAHVPSRAVADEVLQETWMAVIKGIDGFEGRASLRTWVTRILTNLAMKRGMREGRSLPFSALAGQDPDGPAVDPDRFLGPDHDRWPGHWAVGPTAWPTPEGGVLAGELREVILSAVDALPPAQRTVIALRDIEGWDSDEVSEALGITLGNQRVLLHRARSRVRAAIERYHGAVERTV